MSRARDIASLLNTVATDAEIANKIDGDGSITDIIALTQASYDEISPDNTTLYVVTD